MFRIISILISLAYLGICAGYLNVYLKEDSRLRPAVRVFTGITVALHLVFLVFLGLHLGRHPITTVFEAAGIIAFFVALTFMYTDIRVGARSSGIFIFFFIFLLQLVSSLFGGFFPGKYEMMRGIILPAHIYLALSGYAAFTTGFLYNVMYLLLHRDIRGGRFGRLFRSFPSLEELDELNYRTALAGLGLLLASIILGFVWYNITFDALPLADAKVMFTLFAWMLYSVVLVCKWLFGWHGSRIAILSICGFVIVMSSFTIVNILARSFHAHF